MRGVIQKLSLSHSGRFINLVFMEIVGGIKIGGSLLRYMCDCPNSEYLTGRLQILVSNVMKKVLFPMFSAPQPITKSSDLDILNTCLELLRAVKDEGSKRSNNDNKVLWTGVSDGDLLKEFPGDDIGDRIQEICATPVQADHLLGFGQLELKNIPHSIYDKMLPGDALID
eukprot:8257550-Ditylum_brightwellii.AAC.1